MTGINHWLWTAGLALQCLLLIALLVRGIAPRFPIFTLLIAFYATRSALLFGLFGHVAPATYRTIYNGLSPADIFLQLMVAGELGFRGLQKRGWSWPRRAALPGLIVLAAAAVAWSVAIAVPARGPVPLDRGVVFTSAVMLLLFPWMIWLKAPRLPRTIAAGFAFYSAISLMAAVERSRLAFARNASAYAAWSYVQAGAYLVVLFFWLFALRGDRERQDVIPLSARPTAT
jgi:hypothetical protein